MQDPIFTLLFSFESFFLTSKAFSVNIKLTDTHNCATSPGKSALLINGSTPFKMCYRGWIWPYDWLIRLHQLQNLPSFSGSRFLCAQLRIKPKVSLCPFSYCNLASASTFPQFTFTAASGVSGNLYMYLIWYPNMIRNTAMLTAFCSVQLLSSLSCSLLRHCILSASCLVHIAVITKLFLTPNKAKEGLWQSPVRTVSRQHMWLSQLCRTCCLYILHV